jgi:hypothetical protein
LTEPSSIDMRRDVLDWLCEDDNPSVRYLTLKDLLDREDREREVVEAKKRIMQYGVVPKILSKLRSDGHYENPAFVKKFGQASSDFGYTPKYKATTWQVILFAEFCANGKDERIRRSCQYVLDHCFRQDGLISMHGSDFLTPCFQGNMIWSLTKLGHGGDPRVKKALALLLRYQRFDDGGFKTPREWPYHGRNDRCSDSHSCYAGCARGLKAVAAIPKQKWNKEIEDYVQRGTDFFLSHHVYKSSHDPSQLLHRDITQLKFPIFVFSNFLDILDILLELEVKESRMQEAVDLLKSKRKPSGRWILEKTMPNMHTKIETQGKDSKWITYKALRALKRWETQTH